uniref:Carbohydrate kinase PfkB domain-containing protein n=1 Tax=Homalodisca liturata TaxID=320908 RepID=A0A1B6HE21_9HEMI
MPEKRILCVGLMCVDLIQVCKDYPIEDSDQRSTDHRWQRGGNASNNCTVISKCGQICEYLGTMSDDMLGRASVIVAWGEAGAAGQVSGGEVVDSPASPPPAVVDTLGAGDTFLAATIVCLSQGYDLRQSIAAGCRIAGVKVGSSGFSSVHPNLIQPPTNS